MLLAMLFAALAVPASVFGVGVYFMRARCGYERVEHCLQQAPDKRDRKPLNQRFMGYSAQEALVVWQRLDANAVKAEQCFLRLDLYFPIAYGMAVFFGLLVVWRVIGMPFAEAWLLIPIVLTVVADWTENLIHLQQLQRYLEHGRQGIQANWIAVASVATITKLLVFAMIILCLLGMVIYAAFHLL